MVKARAHELSTLLEAAPAALRYLSLDCFDTLVWRDVNAPADVFADIAIDGGALGPRRLAESAARRAAVLEDGRSEIGITEIHRRLRAGDEAVVAASVAEELAAEARHCFGFAPVMTLIEQAKARGLRVIIVSDTYLDEAQLRTLIGTAVGERVAALIDRVFCSSQYGVSKAQGLFDHVLDALGARPAEILHLGDNEAADLTAPTALGIHGVHFVQFDDDSANRLRLEASVASVLDSRIRQTLPAAQPHRAMVSARVEADAAFAIGHDVLGPVLTAYGAWLRGEVEELAAATGRRVHLLFLLRDGFLPAMAYRDQRGESELRTIEISRLTAMRSSFRDHADIQAHLARTPKSSEAAVVAQQLLFSRDEIARIAPRGVMCDDRAFRNALQRPSTVAKIVARSRRFADRLVAHLARAGVAAGDAVVFADLGYNGTVQNLVTPVLEERLGLHIAGRYLLFREETVSGFDKRGYLDTRTLDFRTIDALCAPISVVEQLCTKTQGSVVDYRENGEPVRSSDTIKQIQSATRDRIQQGCVAYARASCDWQNVRSRPTAADADRLAALGLLGRLLFLPMRAELDVLRSFEHDVNCGSRQRIRFMDVDASAADLRRRGMLYVGQADRMFVPGEIRLEGLPLSLSLLTTRRFGLDLKGADFQGEPIKLPVVMMDQGGQAAIEVDAWATHDGYYAAAIPVGRGQFSVAIRWGQLFEWVEIKESGFHRLAEFGEAGSTDHAAIAATVIPDAMDAVGGALHACTSAASFTLTPPPRGTGDDVMLLNVVFRPTVRRTTAVTIRQVA